MAGNNDSPGTEDLLAHDRHEKLPGRVASWQDSVPQASSSRSQKTVRRIPDNDSHYISTTTSKSGKTQVIDHGTRAYDPEEPRASDARYEDYKRTNDYPRRKYYSGYSGSSKLENTIYEPMPRKLASEHDSVLQAPLSPSQKKHKCPYCETEFNHHHNLKSHLLAHSQEKPYICQECSMRFRRLHDLKRHSKLHTGERPHICPKCDRKFARGDALARHSKAVGGCAGKIASMGGLGSGDDDYEDSNAGNGDDTGMDRRVGDDCWESEALEQGLMDKYLSGEKKAVAMDLGEATRAEIFGPSSQCLTQVNIAGPFPYPDPLENNKQTGTQSQQISPIPVVTPRSGENTSQVGANSGGDLFLDPNEPILVAGLGSIRNIILKHMKHARTEQPKSYMLQDFEALTSNLPHSANSHRRNASFDIHWDVKTFMKEQFEDGCKIPIGSVITLTGSALYTQAETVADYLQQHWGSAALLDALQQSLDFGTSDVSIGTLLIHFC
jgi:hypothetical protein